MSLTTDRILPTNLAVLRNTGDQTLFSKKKDSTLSPQAKLTDPREINLGEETEGNLTTEDIILSLESIAQEKLGSKIGFKSEAPKEKKDIILGKKAAFLAHALITNPTKEIAETALEFLAVIALIKELEQIVKERKEPDFGFKSTPKSKEDKDLGEKAAKIALTLTLDPTNANIKVAIKFLGLMELIVELEDIGKEKTRRETMGFRSQEKEKDEIKLGESAFKIAQILKKSPTKESIKIAMQFLELVSAFDSLKFKKDLKERIENCIGFGCIQKNKKKTLQKVA